MVQPSPAQERRGGARPCILHASAVSLGGAGVLITGASGRGKSRLALELMALGARLLSDDRTCVGRRGAEVIAWAPPAILGMIEARGVGLLRAEPAPPAPLVLAVDLDTTETRRLPPVRRCSILDREVRLLHGSDHPFLAATLLQILKGGWAAS